MLSKLRPRSVYDVMAAIACVALLGGGTAYAANTVRTGDIVDNEVFTTDVRDDTLGYGGLQHQDLGSGSVRSSEIAPFSINEGDVASAVISNRHINDGTLNDEDISERAIVNFTGTIGTVPAQRCVDRFVTGVVGAPGDHLVLTPNWQDTQADLDYSAQHTALTEQDEDAIAIHVCNPTSAAINDGTTRFNLLVIDAQ